MFIACWTLLLVFNRCLEGDLAGSFAGLTAGMGHKWCVKFLHSSSLPLELL